MEAKKMARRLTGIAMCVFVMLSTSGATARHAANIPAEVEMETEVECREYTNWLEQDWWFFGDDRHHSSEGEFDPMSDAGGEWLEVGSVSASGIPHGMRDNWTIQSKEHVGC